MPKRGYIKKEETKKKISQKMKGQIPWNKGLTKEIDDRINKYSKNNSSHFKSGHNTWNKGLTKETNNSMMIIAQANTGDKNPAKRLDVKQKMSLSRKKLLSNPRNHPMYGKHHTEKSKEKMRNKKIGVKQSKETIEKRIKRGKDHYNYQHGKYLKPYCKKWTEQLREEIRERDNRICQECNKTERNNKRKLSVHHIHYDKDNCYPDLITLCCSCSAKVNYNRNYWEEHFMNKLKERNLLNYFG